MKTSINHLLIVILCLLSDRSFAWGFGGHKITGAIASQNISTKVKDSLAVYLGGSTLEDAAAWMEQVRTDRAYDYLRPFHYINIEKGQEYKPGNQDNIITELNKVIGELKERNKYSKEQIALDLKILCHLIGDLHQPLKVGYPVDRGGNNVGVTFLNTRSNLHKVWDNDIIEQYSISSADCLAAISGFSSDSLNKIKHVDTIAWLNETRNNLPQVYDFNNPEIDKAYCKKNKALIEKQLGLSGVRLAQILSDLFLS